MLQKIATTLVTIPAANQALAAMEKQIDQTRSYEELKKIIGAAEALRQFFKDVEEVKQRAEWTILIGKRRIGEEIAAVPKERGPGGVKGTKAAFTQAGKSSGRGALGIPGSSRRRLLQLAEMEKPTLRKIARTLWSDGGDATLRRVVTEGLYGDFKKQRARRERVLAEKIRALPQRRYGVILADPEWKFETYSERGKVMTSAEKHYTTNETDVIKDRDVDGLAAKDCVLFLWGTVPMLPQALEVMDSWGFKYVTNVAWDKMKTGTGYWFMNQHEHLLVGTRGKVVAPAPGTQFPSVIREKARQHSRKPEQSYKIIEAYFPNVPKIELNCRGAARDGWDAWGNEATQ